MVRFVNASLTIDSFDVWIQGEGTPFVTGIGAGQASPYLEPSLGETVFELRPAGSGVGTSPFLTSDPIDFADGSSITAIADGAFANGTYGNTTLLPVPDSFGDFGDDAAVRLVNLNTDDDAFTGDIGNDGTEDFTVLAAGTASAPGGVPAPSLTAAQLGLAAVTSTAFTTPQLPEGAGVYGIIRGSLSQLPRLDTSLAVLFVGPDGVLGESRQNPRLHILHVSPDVGEVDICQDGSVLVDDIEFGDLRDVQLPADQTYDLDIHGSVGVPCGGPLIFDVNTPTLDAGSQHLAPLMGEEVTEAGDLPLDLGFFEEEFSLDAPASASTLRLVHAASGPVFRVGTIPYGTSTQIQAADTLVSFLNPGTQSSDDFPVEPDTLRIGLGSDSDDTPPFDIVARFPVVATPNGLRGWILPIGDISPAAAEPSLRLVVLGTGALPGDWSVLESVAGTVL